MKRVPWVPGASARPAPVRPEPPSAPEVRRAVWIARKRTEVAAEVTRLELQARVTGPRADVDARLAFEHGRAAFLDWCATADAAALAAKGAALVEALGPDTVAALHAGALRVADVPPAVAQDLAALSILHRLLRER